jgi:uncharacterized protein YhbP (UPF0306 family)
LNSQTTLALATTSPDGSCRVAPVFYLADEHLRLYWFSSASSEHSRNLERDARAAATVFVPTDQWQEIRGVQLRGRVSVINDEAVRDSIALTYTERYRLDDTFQAIIGRAKLYVFDPDWVRYLDNSKYFGYQDEFELIVAGRRPA